MYVAKDKVEPLDITVKGWTHLQIKKFQKAINLPL